ncbi:MAG: hypothetical protein BWY71_01599 [Planctomycetes bacterium ADurb.Bin412]|nr:MAG: hypothetical protein BWY71_01599 [Planctomycetes bacterium ADurb.Bin412]
MNPNLDAGQPLLLGIAGGGYSHAVVADGYGYDSGTLYHHINFGWNGSNDAWYALPNVDTYTNIGTCIYNVRTAGSGEIISGRVTDAAGNPLAGAEVSCKIGSTVVQQITTNARGIYALCGLAKQQTYTVSAAKPPYGFLAQQAATGDSQDYEEPGNVWGVDFASVTAGPPTAFDGQAEALSGTAAAILLEAADDQMPNPPGQLEYVIMSLPGAGTLADPNGGMITAVPYTLVNNGHTVLYTGCPYFDGDDSFGFRADDGGTAPQGGASNTATVTVSVDNHIYTIFEPDLYTIADFPFHSSRHDARIQSIYHPDELDGAQTITALSLKVHQVPGQTLNEWTIRMQHTNWTDYGVGDFLAGGWTTVYQGTEPVGSTGWRTFTFQTPFVYNGIQNLLIDFSFDNTYNTSNGMCFVSDPGDGTRSYMDYADGEKGDPLNWDWAGWLAGYLPNIKLISTVTAEAIPGDVSRNCRVDLPDVGLLAAAWLSEAGQPEYRTECDVSPSADGVIDLLDFAVLAENWLASYWSD